MNFIREGWTSYEGGGVDFIRGGWASYEWGWTSCDWGWTCTRGVDFIRRRGGGVDLYKEGSTYLFCG